MSGPLTAQSLLHGAVYSLKQCGLLLGDAKLLYENGSYATALAVAAFAREDLGRWQILLALHKRVCAGESLNVEDVKTACDDHVRKQEAGMTSLTLRADHDLGIGKLLQSRSKAPLGSEERKEADQQVDKIDQLKSKRTPDDRHRLRMKALYVDILSEEQWNQPAREISQTAAYEFLVDATNDYQLQRQQRYLDLSLVESVDQELHEALVQWSDRPELPQVEVPSYPGASPAPSLGSEARRPRAKERRDSATDEGRKPAKNEGRKMESASYPSRVTLTDVAQVIDAAKDVRRPFDNDTAWWRGHAKADWRLQAHVHRRDPERQYDETMLTGHFVSRAPSRSHRPCPATDDYFGWLFLAQHYGLPTRLLDWTESPLVAAYFAVQDSHVDEDGCIWALWPTGLNRTFRAADGLVQIRDPRVAEIAESAFTGHESSEEILAIDGQEIDPRMLAHMSRFTLHSHRAALELARENNVWLRQYVIPKNDKAKIRAQLSALGIRRSNLFPDLQNLAGELKDAIIE